ncbi:ABC transporter ATP-binding protein [uncultured Corynebacterium sp.]|uniref:ABC transporter ATP-binding protein n=1 Tax=uncultured Corynebacterium sp. TaxID=159447 RepID=UPI0025FADFF2|nr:ABC transporter ATP-binding protein [uncultured Corynebacterium sp.]
MSARLHSSASATASSTDTASTRPAPLELRDVSVVYPDGNSEVTALDHVSVAVPAGTLTAVTGESGSGKSTLLTVAAGLVTPTSGEVIIDGQHVESLGEEERASVRRERVGLVFQQANLLAALSVRDQLLVMDHLRGARPRTEHADELLDLVGLAGLGDRRVGQLSGGQRQRVNIARALMASPAVLLADEPTSALDSALSAQVTQLLLDVTRELGTATMLVTHSASVAAAADAVLVMRDGHLSAPVLAGK